jgi:hypothetical protein
LRREFRGAQGTKTGDTDRPVVSLAVRAKLRPSPTAKPQRSGFMTAATEPPWVNRAVTEAAVGQHLDQGFQIVDSSLARHVDRLGRQPPDADEHVYGADIVLLRHGLLGRLLHPSVE